MWARSGSRMISATDGEPQRERLFGKLENQEIFGGAVLLSRDKRVSGRRKIGRFAGRWRLLAIATLNGFRERGDFLDRRREILGTPRLLLGRRRGLCRCAGGFLGDRSDLPGALSGVLHRGKNGFGAGRRSDR